MDWNGRRSEPNAREVWVWTQRSVFLAARGSE
jgi:hypothetical protein